MNYKDETLQAIFVYQPVSGDRVFALNPLHPVARMGNLSRWVVCAEVVEVHAAQMTHHWRSDAHKAVEGLVKSLGGLGADEQGTVRYYAPTPLAACAARAILTKLATRAGDTDGRNQLALQAILAGAPNPMEPYELSRAIGLVYYPEPQERGAWSWEFENGDLFLIGPVDAFRLPAPTGVMDVVGAAEKKIEIEEVA